MAATLTTCRTHLPHAYLRHPGTLCPGCVETGCVATCDLQVRDLEARLLAEREEKAVLVEDKAALQGRLMQLREAGTVRAARACPLRAYAPHTRTKLGQKL